MQAKSKIEEQVMASVALVYTARQLTSKIALEFYALVLSGLALWKLVWVHKVLANFFIEERSGSGFNYIAIAFEHAHMGVLVVLAVAACAFVALCFDMARATPAHTFA